MTSCTCIMIGIMMIRMILCDIQLEHCRFAEIIYGQHSKIFHFDQNQTFLSIRPLYSLTNQSLIQFSLGLIYHIDEFDLLPLPLLFQCSLTEQIYTPDDCQLTIGDSHSDSSKRLSEPTHLRTVQLNFHHYSTYNIRGAFFKQSKITLDNCRLKSADENLFISTKFYLDIQFEQKINSSCEQTCFHPDLYQCSSKTNTCQCRLKEFQTNTYPQLCIDHQTISNCSFSPERCIKLPSTHYRIVIVLLLILLMISFVIIIILVICLVKFSFRKSISMTMTF